MDVFTSAVDLLRDRHPERPVLALRPHAARRAANWFLANFPGRVLYAAKANDAPVIMDALVEAGVRAFDVASLVEIERVSRIPDAELYFMNPIKSRGAIVAAYRDFGHAAATPLVQLDEPALPMVLAGDVPTASGLNRLPAPEPEISPLATSLTSCKTSPVFGVSKSVRKIVPLAVIGTRQVMPKGRLRTEPAFVRLIVHDQNIDLPVIVRGGAPITLVSAAWSTPSPRHCRSSIRKRRRSTP